MIVRWLMANTTAIDVRDARRQDLLRRSTDVERVPRRRRPAARRGAAHQGRRRLRGGASAVRDLRRALRSGAARRSRGARRPAAVAVAYRVRDAAAGSRRPTPRGEITDVDDFVSAGFDRADAGVLRRDAAICDNSVADAQPTNRDVAGSPRRFSACSALSAVTCCLSPPSARCQTTPGAVLAGRGSARADRRAISPPFDPARAAAIQTPSAGRGARPRPARAAGPRPRPSLPSLRHSMPEVRAEAANALSARPLSGRKRRKIPAPRLSPRSSIRRSRG